MPGNQRRRRSTSCVSTSVVLVFNITTQVGLKPSLPLHGQQISGDRSFDAAFPPVMHASTFTLPRPMLQAVEDSPFGTSIHSGVHNLNLQPWDPGISSSHGSTCLSIRPPLHICRSLSSYYVRASTIPDHTISIGQPFLLANCAEERMSRLGSTCHGKPPSARRSLSMQR